MQYTCTKCLRCFCSDCLNKRDTICKSCRVLNTWPVGRAQLQPLKARDIKAYLSANGVSTHGCVGENFTSKLIKKFVLISNLFPAEKEELVELALSHLGSRHQSAPMPPYNPQRVSSRLVDDSWVLINSRTEASSSSSGDTEPHNASNNASSNSSPSSHLPPDVLPSQPPAINVVPDTASEAEEMPAAEEAEPSSPHSIPIPGARTVLEPEEPMSTSLPQMMPDVLPNPLLANVMGAGLSGSQPNLNGAASMASTSAAAGVPQRSTSETILSISRTNVSLFLLPPKINTIIIGRRPREIC